MYRIFLETGNLHHAAIRFYKKSGFHQVESFGNYKPNKVSVYFGKTIKVIPEQANYVQQIADVK